jgi:IMP dehydrogenase
VTYEIEIGRGKRGRRAYSLDDIAIVPNRRTRDPKDVSVSWQIDAYKFDMPVIAAPMDSAMSPATAIALGKLGGLGVLDLEGLWTRYEDPQPVLDEIGALEDETNSPAVTGRMQELYKAPIQPELITSRLAEIRAAGITVAGSLTPQRTQEHYKTVVAAGVDIFVIRGTTVSAEHVSKDHEPLNLKQFIYELDVPVIVGGAAGYTPALHLMRTGAAGVLVGFGGGATTTTRRALGIHSPMASAISDVAAARRDYMDESGGRYVHVIADGGMGTSGDIVKAIAMGADAVMLGTALGPGGRGPRQGLALGPGSAPPRTAARRQGQHRNGRPAGRGALRARPPHQRNLQPDRRAPPLHGHHRLFGPQGVPAGRRRGFALRRKLTLRPRQHSPAALPIGRRTKYSGELQRSMRMEACHDRFR